MSDHSTGHASGRSADPGPGPGTEPGSPVLEPLDEAECLQLISPGGLGRLVYSGRFDLTVLPVNYRMHEGSIVFRTAEHSPTDEDLRTGIAGAEYRVAFEVDDVNLAAREGWSVLIQGSAHHVESEAERASVAGAGIESWAGGDRRLFILITPSRITGRRIRHI